MSQIVEPAAGLGWRIAARLVDTITLAWIVGFVLIEIDQRLLGGDPFGLQPERIDLSRARSMLLLFALIAAYEVVPTVLYGATLGKAVLGLRVRAVNGGQVRGAFSLARVVLLYGPTLFLGAFGLVADILLFVTVAIPASGRGFHDRVASTVVVSLPRDAQ